MVNNENIEFVAIDPDESQAEWSVAPEESEHSGKMLGGLTTIHGIGPKKANQIIRARKGTEKWTPSMVRLLSEGHTPFKILFPTRHYWGDLFSDPQSLGLDKPPVEIKSIVGAGEYLLVGKLVDKNLRDLNEYQSVVKRGGNRVKDHTLFINMIVEDDTDSIVAQIGRFDFERLGGAHIAETGKEGVTWYLIKGVVKDKFRRFFVREIIDLNQWRPESLA